MKNYFISIVVLCISIFLTGCFFATSNDEFHIYFLDKPCIVPHYEYTYLTCGQITILINQHGIVTPIIIPGGFLTDLASIPRWLWPIIAPARSDFIGAAILHDYLYAVHSGFTRSQIDRILLHSLIENGTSPLRAYQMYVAVRMFGSKYFDKGVCHEEH